MNLKIIPSYTAYFHVELLIQLCADTYVKCTKHVILQLFLFTNEDTTWQEALISIVMLAVIFIVKGAQSLTGKGGVELDMMLLAGCLVIILIGLGRISASYILKKVPRFLQLYFLVHRLKSKINFLQTSCFLYVHYFYTEYQWYPCCKIWLSRKRKK